MARLSSSLLVFALAAMLCLAQAGDVFSVQSITKISDGRYDVKLQNPKTKYVHSVTLVVVELLFKVGDMVRETRTGGKVVLTPANGGGSSSSTPPSAPKAPQPPPPPQPITLSGQADHRVWSGPWWPEKPSSTQLYGASGPLEAYGRWTGDGNPLQWERLNHSTPPAANAAWTGHCDGFSVSSSVYGEPRRAVAATRTGGASVSFSPGDIKGLLAANWAGFDWQGSQRAAGGPAGVSAYDFHRFVLFYIHENRLPIVVNTKKDVVWNYPADSFQMTATPTGANRWRVAMTLTLADDGVDAAFQGKQPMQYAVAYDLTGDPSTSGGVQTAEWTSAERPGWIFCPLLGKDAAGLQARPSAATTRHHPYADTTFQALAEGLAKVSSGEVSEWTWNGYKVTPAP
ncbi:MAG: hypothetical protein GC160_09165 [Acidobacteria bacterium]|nr:hypothetical protein [Acidobacteriota bacterium]